jgi:hypothetical protein
MTCAEVRSHFSDLLDQGLTSAEAVGTGAESPGAPGDDTGATVRAADRAAIAAHLATCSECAHELAALRKTLALLHAVDPVAAPIGFVDRVLERVSRPWSRRLARWLVRPLHVKLPLEAAAIVAVSIGVA